MRTKYRVLELLRGQDGYLSGEMIADDLGVSRTAVWKAVKALTQEGYPIESHTGTGYRMGSRTDVLSAYELEQGYIGVRAGTGYIYERHVDSTNQYAKRLAERGAVSGTVIMAGEQSDGKGRMSRGFYSPPETGVYFSVILRPELHISTLHLLTLTAALSVTDALEEIVGTRPFIKWPNDIMVDGKKICGILTESSVESETGRVQYAVIGIGVNVNQEEFPQELEEIAISLKQVCGCSVNRAAVIIRVLRRLDFYLTNDYYLNRKDVLLEQYKKDLFLLGEDVKIICPDRILFAKALDVAGDGGLVIQKQDGTKETVYGGEVSIRRACQDRC